jgi:dCTP diphosphatase
MSQIEHIQKRIRKFRDERDWMQFHNPKNLACSISIEAAELLEHFQWKTPAEAEKLSQEKLGEISHELADIAVYVLEMADNLEIDLAKAIEEKIRLNEAKYPVAKAKGSAAKYTEL